MMHGQKNIKLEKSVVQMKYNNRIGGT